MREMLINLICAYLFVYAVRESTDVFFFKKEIRKVYYYLTWWVFCIILMLGTHFLTNSVFLLVYNSICYLILSFILYHGSIRKRILWIIFLNLVSMISDLAVGYVFILFSMDLTENYILGSVVSKILMLVVMIIIKACNRARFKRDIAFSYWLAVMIVPAGSVVILNIIYKYSGVSSGRGYATSAIVSTFILVLMNTVYLSMYDKIADKLELQRQQSVFNSRLELYKEKIQEVKESTKEIQTLRHDMKNRLLCLKGYLEEKDYALAEEYVDNLLDSEILHKKAYSINTGNFVFDILLNYKYRIMEKRGIRFNTCFEIPDRLTVNDEDICIILGNILDNAIEAVSKYDDPDKKVITLKIIARNNTLLIDALNPYDGRVIRDNLGNYLSSKEDAENHGLGLASVKKSVNRYNGCIDIDVNNNIFNAQILLYCPGE